MILYIILEFVMINLSLIHLKIIFPKKETETLSRCKSVLTIILFAVIVILYLKERQVEKLNWELENFSMIGLCLYTALITGIIFMFYWYVITKKEK